MILSFILAPDATQKGFIDFQYHWHQIKLMHLSQRLKNIFL